MIGPALLWGETVTWDHSRPVRERAKEIGKVEMIHNKNENALMKIIETPFPFIKLDPVYL